MQCLIAFTLAALLAVSLIRVADATSHSGSGKDERAEQSASEPPPSSSQRHSSVTSFSSRASAPSLESRQYAGEQVVFSDDFDTFDLEVWEHEITMAGGGNWEFQLYTNNRSNSFVSDSVLYLKPTLTRELIGEENVINGYTMDMWGSSPADLCTGNAFYGCERTAGAGGGIINPIQSARIRTASSLSIRYGRVEVAARLPRGDWLWPAIWMLPRYNAFGQWPASGEIDIMESHGNAPGYSGGGHDCVMSSLHFGPFYGEDPWQLTHANLTLPAGSDHDFHIFGLKWTSAGLYSYVDDDSNRLLDVDFSRRSFWQRGGWDSDGSAFANPWTGRGNAAPFDEKFYLVMNVAVGGVSQFFPDGEGGKPWANADADAASRFYADIDSWLPTWDYGSNQAALQVDWVKVWQ